MLEVPLVDSRHLRGGDDLEADLIRAAPQTFAQNILRDPAKQPQIKRAALLAVSEREFAHAMRGRRDALRTRQ